MRISDWSSDVCSSDLNGRTGGVQRVVDAVLAFLHFNFSRAANLDHCNAASKLGKTLLELFTVVIAGGDFDLLTDRFHAALDRIGFTGAINDGGVVLVDGDALGLAEHTDGHALRSEAHTSELQSLMRISYAVFCLKKKK